MKRIICWLTGLYISAAMATAAVAQIPDNPGPPQSANDSSSLYVYICAFILIAGVCIAAFRSSKRTHLD